MEMNTILEFIKDNKEIVAIFAANIIPTGALIVSIQQLKQVKAADKKQDEKVAVDNAINYIDRFSKGVLPHYQEYKALVHDSVIKAIEIPVAGFQEFDCLEVEDLDKKELTDVYKYVNELDIIAAAVLKGHVDYHVTKSLIGSLYCEAVEVYYDLICLSRQASPQHFQMTVQLYKEWRKNFPHVQSPVNTKKQNSLHKKIKEGSTAE
jgi:hypothetical protein